MAEHTAPYRQDFDPAYRVPSELWSEIFRLACNNWNYYTSLNPSNLLLVIRNVCHRWRDIIESLPELWTKIRLTDCWSIPKGIDQDIPNFLSTRLRLLSNILHISGDKPLHIIFDTPEYDPDVAALLHPHMLVLAQHYRRWAELDIEECSNRATSRAIASSLSLFRIDGLPSLKTLQISVSVDYDGQPGPAPLKHFMPKLRILTVNYGCPELDTLPWGLVETVKLNNLTVDDLRRVIPHLQSAVDIKILFDDDWDCIEENFHTQMDYTLPALTQLASRFWDIHLFPRMKAPSLRILIIDWLRAKYLPTVMSLITRSRCSITNLTFHNFSCEYTLPTLDSALRSFFASLPDLQTLTLGFEEFEGYRVEVAIEPLSQKSGRQMLRCPHLQELDIICDGFRTRLQTLTALVDMIEIRWVVSRLSNNSGLRVVAGIPSWSDDMSDLSAQGFEEQYNRLKSMESEGLEVRYID